MTRERRLPRPVGPGSRLGIAALSGPVDSERLDAGVECLRSLGFEPVLAPNLLSRHDLFAGTDIERLEGFHQLLRSQEIEGVVFARGGHGLLRLLPKVDWDLIGRRSLPLVGYSDVTPLLNHVVDRCNLVTFHGPMVATDLCDQPLSSELDCLVEMLEGKVEREFEISVEPGPSRQGTLRGGCLSMIAATAGTPFASSFSRSLVVLEDVGEPIYRWDRMLTHLHLSGTLEGAQGLLFGHHHGGSGLDEETWLAWLERISSEFEPTVGHGLLFGHGRPNLTLPLGVEAILAPDQCSLSTLFPCASDSRPLSEDKVQDR